MRSNACSVPESAGRYHTPMRVTHIRAIAGIALAAAAATAAACGGESRPAVAPTSAPTSGASTSAPAAGADGDVSVEAPLAFGADEAIATIATSLEEFRILAPTEAPAGKLFVSATNIGQATHEIVVTRAGAPDEEGAIAEADEINPGETESVAVDLPPGRYQFACYIREESPTGAVVDHYKLGMVQQFEVK